MSCETSYEVIKIVRDHPEKFSGPNWWKNLRSVITSREGCVTYAGTSLETARSLADGITTEKVTPAKGRSKVVFAKVRSATLDDFDVF